MFLLVLLQNIHMVSLFLHVKITNFLKGIDKIKNFVVMLPGALFFISGGLIIYDSIYQIVKNSIAIAEPLLSEVSSLPTLCV